jgi:uncharacterized membrane protein HdeD (DUF308 family)
MLLRALARNWWLLTLRGACALAFGVMAMAWPGITIGALVFLFGCYATADGVLALFAAIKGDRVAPRWWLALGGVLGICIGLAALFMPGATAVTLLYLIAAWAICVGFLQITGALRLREEIDNEWMLIMGGALSVFIGAAIMLRPAAGALAIVLLIGAFAIVFGVTLILFSLRLRSGLKRIEETASRAGKGT